MTYDIVIKDAIVIDGRGRKPFHGAIGIKNRRIRALGDEELDADHVINCEGRLVAAPGFFDMHSHSDLAMFFPESSDYYGMALESKVTQGITSEVVGQDGFSAAPISEEAKTLYASHWKSLAGYLNPDKWHWNTIEDYLEAVRDTSFPTRIETLVGHGTLRINVMGYENRKAKPSELEEMQEQLKRSIRQGARGVSLGLPYIPGMYADEAELAALATIVAQENGVVVAHIRNESDKVFETIEDFLRICKTVNARSHISHFKIHGTKNIQRGDELATNLLAAMAEGQSISFDMYPYDASIENLVAILPPWAQEGGSEEILERLRDSETCNKMAFDALSGGQRDWGSIIQLSRGGMEGIMIFDAPESHKNIIGKSLADLGREAGYDLVMEDDRLGVFHHLCQLLVDTNLNISVVSFNQSMENVEQFQKLDVVMTIGTNGVLRPSPHPSLFGAMIRYLRWAQTQNIPLEIAIHNITQHAASILRLDRGLLDIGTAADIVIFDPKQISDQATYENPKMQSIGVEHVIVDGKIIL
ncbi:MAG: amidohydrolase family protein [Candidatus Hodarchaeota archaeon]